ncbi:MAG TPA: Ig-like domain-containing protein, partial [Kofleriaceae bacterium]|nr:Ig-like domain-containing protein [Kofleriaceae bacterium]
CGELSARACQCGGSSMNSYEEILQTFGGTTPTPPMVGISTPRDGDSVSAGFPIRADITDDVAVNKAELSIDGKIVSTLMAFPYVWNAPMTLGQGRHKLKVTGYDVANTPASVEIEIALGKVCTKAADCQRSTDVCVDGRCVAGSNVTGGLGTTCANNSDCASGKCGADATGSHFCVEDCDPAANGCPSGFACLPAGETGGVCWPGGDDGGCSSGAGASGLLLFAVGGLLIALRRRR